MIELIVTIFAGLGFCASVHFVIGLIGKLDKNAKKEINNSCIHNDTTLGRDLSDAINLISLIISISDDTKMNSISRLSIYAKEILECANKKLKSNEE